MALALQPLSKSLEYLRSRLDVYECSQTECDGRTRIIHTVLRKESVSHKCFVGLCQYQEHVIAPHFWINLEGSLEGYRIDYCLRMWLGNNEEIPHGIFKPEDYSLIRYEGDEVNLPLLSNDLFQVLITPFPQI